MESGAVRRQRRALVRYILICALAFAAGMGLWVYNQFHRHPPPPAAPPRAAGTVVSPEAMLKPMAVPAPTLPVIAAPIPGPRYVHRGGSVLRDKPKSSGHSLKKEAKGAKVILEALEDGGWAKVTDGNMHGWMRASVLGVNPPESN